MVNGSGWAGAFNASDDQGGFEISIYKSLCYISLTESIELIRSMSAVKQFKSLKIGNTNCSSHSSCFCGMKSYYCAICFKTLSGEGDHYANIL